MTGKRILWILVIAALFAALARFFLFDTYRVASDAMAEFQAKGDRLLVEKWSLGARLPQAIKWPFIKDKAKSRWILSEKVNRLPGLSNIHREDLLVFNQPLGKASEPVNLRPVLLSRCVGLPGDFVRLDGTSLYVNEAPKPRSVDALFCYHYWPAQNALVEEAFKAAGMQRPLLTRNDTGFLFMPQLEYMRLLIAHPILKVALKPYASTMDNLSTLVPYRGYTIPLDRRSMETWQALINSHEGVSLTEAKDSSWLLNGVAAAQYTFKQDYYVVLNDHQGYLNDSRRFGLVPASHVIGRASLLLFSPEKKHLFQRLR
ncbi:MAG TPA: signal peptidase I [Bacteroidales bacterium]|nr:MAG: signal peptidase I [Bacteroidetes bacterium ADurb.Bin416]HBL72565.1 signal peptidase I [Bacteroidales bacterium]